VNTETHCVRPKFLLLFKEKMTAGGVSILFNAHYGAPPDDGKGNIKIIS